MCIVTMKTVTQAQKARSALDVRGIRCEIVGLDPTLTARGCSYGIRIPCEKEQQVLTLLEQKKIPWGTVLGGEGQR